MEESKPLRVGEPCGHPGCLNHVSHPCEGCGRIAGQPQFVREPRYAVLKFKDIMAAGLSDEEIKQLERIRRKVWAARKKRGKSALYCVVVESDWPEYELVWDMIEKRCGGGE